MDFPQPQQHRHQIAARAKRRAAPIDEGTYGTCPECDEPISPKRLDALPWARFCVKCQEKIAARIAAGDYDAELEEAER